MINLFSKSWLKKSFLAVCLLMTNAVAMASSTGGTDLPFVSTMDTLENAIKGPFLLSASIIMVVVTCLMLAFGEFGDGFKKIINIVMWLSIAFAATSFITSLFGSGAVC